MTKPLTEEWLPIAELLEPRRIAGLGDHKLPLVEGAVPRRLVTASLRLSKLKKGEARHDPRSEDQTKAMGLQFKLVAPRRNGAAIEKCARGIDAMAREGDAYWLGMAMHRKNTRRVLAVLRLLLSSGN